MVHDRHTPAMVGVGIPRDTPFRKNTRVFNDVLSKGADAPAKSTQAAILDPNDIADVPEMSTPKHFTKPVTGIYPFKTSHHVTVISISKVRGVVKAVVKYTGKYALAALPPLIQARCTWNPSPTVLEV